MLDGSTSTAGDGQACPDQSPCFLVYVPMYHYLQKRPFSGVFVIPVIIFYLVKYSKMFLFLLLYERGGQTSRMEPRSSY